MRLYLTGIAFLLFISICIGQTNTFPLNGHVGIGTTNPKAILDVGTNIANETVGTVFGRMAEGNEEGNGTFLGVQGFGTQSYLYDNKSFSIIHNFYGLTNSSINFFRGGSKTGGFITINTNSNIERLRITTEGNVGIGIINPQEKLSVNGKIRAKEVKVEAINWPDYVFKADYVLPSLAETEKHIKEKGYLPGMPSAKEVESNGLELGEIIKLQQQKIEELTLYLIEMKKVNEVQSEINANLIERIKRIDKNKK